MILSQSTAQNTTFGTKTRSPRHCVEELRLILGEIFSKKCQEEVIWMDFLVPKHHNKAFILLLSDSRQSQLHFGTKINFLGPCVAKMRLNLASERPKKWYFTKNSNLPLKGLYFCI